MSGRVPPLPECPSRPAPCPVSLFYPAPKQLEDHKTDAPTAKLWTAVSITALGSGVPFGKTDASSPSHPSAKQTGQSQEPKVLATYKSSIRPHQRFVRAGMGKPPQKSSKLRIPHKIPRANSIRNRKPLRSFVSLACFCRNSEQKHATGAKAGALCSLTFHAPQCPSSNLRHADFLVGTANKKANEKPQLAHRGEIFLSVKSLESQRAG
jgi:hypothetical protein